MIVQKATWVAVKNGSPMNIINAVREASIPEHAHIADVNDSFEIWAGDGTVDHLIQLQFVWEDEE